MVAAMATLQQLLDVGDRDGARAAALKVLATRPTDGEALSTLARLALEAGELEVARTHLGRVGPRERQTYEVQLAEAMLQQLSGQADAARIAFAQLTGLFPTRHEGFFALGVSLLDKADGKGAQRALATAVKLAPKHFLYRFRHAEACAECGLFEDAGKELLEAIELRPDFTPAYLAFARLLEESGQTEKALQLFELALQTNPTERRLMAEIARVKMAGGDVARGLADVAQVPGGALGLADELMRADHHDAAIAVCEHLEAIGQGSAKVSLVKGMALENAMKIPEAVETYGRAMQQDPADWSAACNRGLLLLEEAGDDEVLLQEARETLEEAVKRARGRSPEALFNLAILHGRSLEWAQGIALARQVVAHPEAGTLKGQAERLLASFEKASVAAARA